MAAKKISKGAMARYRRFAAEYVIDFNGTRAAKAAGYAEKSAPQQASDLLKIPKVQQLIAEAADRATQGCVLDAQQVLRDLTLLARFDMRSLYDEEGELLPVQKWPGHVARMVSGLEVRKVTTKSGVPMDEYTHKVKLPDRLKAIELLAKHHKLLTEMIEVKNAAELAEAMRAARARALGEKA